MREKMSSMDLSFVQFVTAARHTGLVAVVFARNSRHASSMIFKKVEKTWRE
jgi:hypothetical protein